jgi:predicted CXXCH cytochrome family protein
LCLACHDDYATRSARHHPIGKAALCTDCHSPHAGEMPGMIRGRQRSLCLACHESIRDGIDEAASIHPLTVESGRCSACHQPHNAEARPLLAGQRTALCADCHQDHSRFTHPMGPNVPDPIRPGESLSCLSCHDPHASDERMLLRASPDRALCVECHSELH